MRSKVKPNAPTHWLEHGALTVALFLSVTVSAPRALYARWESAHDNKSDQQLEAMGDEELFTEAFDVCVGRALLEGPPPESEAQVSPVDSGASAYLARIDGVLGSRHDGIVPAWMTTLRSARTGKECQRGFDAFLEAEAPAAPADAEVTEKKAPLKKAPLREKKASTPPHPHPSTQLPPWLAPH